MTKSTAEVEKEGKTEVVRRNRERKRALSGREESGLIFREWP